MGCITPQDTTKNCLISNSKAPIRCCPNKDPLIWKNYTTASKCVNMKCIICSKKIIFQYDCVKCKAGCIYCEKCSLRSGVCLNPIHKKGFEIVWDKIVCFVSGESLAVKYKENFAFIKPVRNTRKCVKCEKFVETGFSCSCGYDLCNEDALLSTKLPLKCIENHDLIIKAEVLYTKCVKCGKANLKEGWECTECYFTLCFECEKIPFKGDKCPNGHGISWKKFDQEKTCFKCNKKVLNGSICETGYILCINCRDEIVQNEEAEKAKITEIFVQEAKKDEKIQEKQNTSSQKETSENLQCKICYENKADTVLYPCKHAGICEKCAKNMNNCSFCNGNLVTKEKIFIQ